MSITDGSLSLAGGEGTEGLLSKQSTWENLLSSLVIKALMEGITWSSYLRLQTAAAAKNFQQRVGQQVGGDVDSHNSSLYGSLEPKDQAPDCLELRRSKLTALHLKSLRPDEHILWGYKVFIFTAN